MRFTTIAAARQYAKLEGIRTHCKHNAVPSRYWSMDDWGWVNCWTVILVV